MSIAPIDGQAYAQGTTVSALRLVRVAAGLSQAELAHRADITRSTISRLENGKERPRGRTIRALTGVLGYPAPVLFPFNDVETAANGLDVKVRDDSAHESG